MNILIVNDDGITADGIRHLVASVRGGFPAATIYVIAPDRQRTASGHGITVRDAMIFKECQFPNADRAWSCSGTPADCVQTGLRFLSGMDVKIDLVCSGINMGSNLGNDVLYSGTVSAALEGIIQGIPSVAFSVCDHDATHFEAFPKLVPQVCRRVLEENSTRWIMNVNVPDKPLDQIRGLRCTRLGERKYTNDFTLTQLEDGSLRYQYVGGEIPQDDLAPDIDVRAFQEDYISITPIHRDVTRGDVMDKVRAWDFSWK